MKKLIFILSIATTFSSCSKKGDVGATGPQGPQGNANVHSFNFTITPGQWQDRGTGGIDYEKFVELSVASITQDILTNGAVIVYQTDATTPTYCNQLPISLPIGTNTINIFPSAVAGKATIEFFLGDYQAPNITTNWSFKVVVISGAAKVAHPEINWNDAKAISKGLNLN